MSAYAKTAKGALLLLVGALIVAASIVGAASLAPTVAVAQEPTPSSEDSGGEAPSGDAGVGLDENGEPRQPGSEGDQPTGDAAAGEENAPGGEAVQDEDGEGSGSGEGSGGGEDSSSGEGSGGGSGEDSGSSGGSDEGDSGSSDDSSGFVGLAVDAAFGILSAFWDASAGDLGEQMTEDLGKALLFMPDPTEGDQDSSLASIYTDVQKLLAPALLMALLVIALLKILASYNVGGHSMSLAKIAHVMAVAVAIAALPLIFSTLSTLSMDLTAALLPEGGDMAGAMLNVLNPVTGLFAATGIIKIILALFALWVLGKVIIIAIIKIITWPLLLIGGVFILTASLLPGCKHFADNWAKMVMLLALLPAVWALELWLGAKLIAYPEAIFGSAANLGGILAPGLFSSVIAIGVLWVISQTPSKMMALAFQGYHPGMSTGLRSAGRWVASAVVMQGTGMAVRAATGAVAGGAAGAAAGGAASKGENFSFNRRITDSYSKSPNGGWVHNNRSMTETYNQNSGSMSAQEMATYLQGRMAQTGQTHSATDTSRSPNNYPQPPRDEPRGGLRAETPGLPGSASQGDAASGDRKYQTGGNPGSTRKVQFVEGDGTRQNPDLIRHPDRGQDPKDSSMYHDGERWRWRK